MAWRDTLLAHYPEAAAGGFSRVDGSVQFFFRVQALLKPSARILEFGAGRGHHLLEDDLPSRHALRKLGGEGRYIAGVDIDPVVTSNPFLDEAHVIAPGGALPFADAHFDMIVSDHVLEHVIDAGQVASEFDRVLKPGGWICARTPNKWSYAGLGVRLVPNAVHAKLLKRLQEGRKEIDVFPTAYRLNSGAALRKFFPPDRFRDASYTWDAEPVYVGSVGLAWLLLRLVHSLTPRPFRGIRMIFLQKFDR